MGRSLRARDPERSTPFFKHLGPRQTLALLQATQGSADVLVVGGALAAAKLDRPFLEGIVKAAQAPVEALDAYVHSWGTVDAKHREQVVLDDYMHRA
jgi:hypothetical protein